MSNRLQAAIKCMNDRDFGTAMDILMDLHQSSPKDPQVNYWIGVIYLTHGKSEQAVAHLSVAAKFAKKEAAIVATLADALSKNNQHEEALVHARKAVALDRNSEIAHCALGEIYSKLRRPVMAEQAFNSALKLNGTSTIAHMAMLRLKNSLGERETAEAHYDAAFEFAPFEPSVLINARDHTDAEKRKSALKNIEAVMSDPDKHMSRIERAQLGFTAGKICDGVGDLSKAFEYFEKYRADMYGQYDPEKQETLLERYKEVFTPHFFEERADFALSSDRPVFVFGMPRSGTSLVEAILSAHPRVTAAGELSFFDDRIIELGSGATGDDGLFNAAQNLDRKTAQRFGRKYLSLLEAYNKKTDRVVDKLPQNFENLWLIALLFPNAHFCHVRRNPADTCTSIYMTPLPGKHSYNRSQESLAHYYGFYARLMKHWESCLPVEIRNQSYEDLVNEPGPQRQALVQHIQLPWDDACAQHENNDAQVFTFSMSQVRKPIYTGSVNRAERYREHMRPLFSGLEDLDDT